MSVRACVRVCVYDHRFIYVWCDRPPDPFLVLTCRYLIGMTMSRMAVAIPYTFKRAVSACDAVLLCNAVVMYVLSSFCVYLRTLTVLLSHDCVALVAYAPL